MIFYRDALKRGRAIIAAEQVHQWEWGDLACELEPKYGEETLERFAASLKQNHGQLCRCRDVARAWPEIALRGAFSVCKELATHPDRFKLLADNPGMTVKAARAEMEKLRREKSQGAVLSVSILSPQEREQRLAARKCAEEKRIEEAHSEARRRAIERLAHYADDSLKDRDLEAASREFLNAVQWSAAALLLLIGEDAALAAARKYLTDYAASRSSVSEAA